MAGSRQVMSRHVAGTGIPVGSLQAADSTPKLPIQAIVPEELGCMHLWRGWHGQHTQGLLMVLLVPCFSPGDRR